MSFSGVIQFILGFIIGVALLAGSSAAAAYLLFSGLASAPPKPVFSEEVEKVATASEEGEAQEASQSSEEELPSGAYKARVTWSEGLILRAEPGVDSERIGGIPFNREIIILEETEDKEWQKVRLKSDKEGWIKSGNIEKVE